jgi:hypothetical protein
MTFPAHHREHVMNARKKRAVGIKKWSPQYASDIMNKENKILENYNYRGGGYYKNQIENRSIYYRVCDEMKPLPKLDKRYYSYFEDNNYHSLNQVLTDLGKF